MHKFKKSRVLYIRGLKTAAFRPQIGNGRSVFRSKKPRTLGRVASLFLLFFLINSLNLYSIAKEEDEKNGLILREGQKKGKTTVGVEARLSGETLEVKIIAKIVESKPLIYNVLVVGPGLGRLSADARETIPATVEDEKPFPITNKKRGFISLSKKTKKGRGRGRITKEFAYFKIPPDRIRVGKKYRLWVQIKSSQREARYQTFKFSLHKLPELMRENSGGGMR